MVVNISTTRRPLRSIPRNLGLKIARQPESLFANRCGFWPFRGKPVKIDYLDSNPCKIGLTRTDDVIKVGINLAIYLHFKWSIQLFNAISVHFNELRKTYAMAGS